jgi:hypothetical protein
MEKQKSIYILAGVFVVLLGLILFRLMKRNEIPATYSLSDQTQVIVSGNSTGSNASELGSVSPETVARWAKWHLKEKELGMRSLSLPKAGKNSLLEIFIQVTPGCTPGDADAIAMELKAAPQHRLLATLEGMSQGLKSFSWELPQDFLSTGQAQNKFEIPATEEPLQYGFYLCLASSGEKSCQNKKIIDINKIFTEHLTKASNAGQEEHVIFYQYLLVDEKGVSIFQESPRGQQRFDELKKYAAERKFQGDNANQGIDQAKEALQTLLSLPIVLEKDHLILELPKYDARACAQKQEQMKGSETK